MMFTESTHHASPKIRMDALLDEIYRLRHRLNEMSRDIGCLSNPTIVEVSQLLDQKLNHYEQIKKKN